MQRHPGLLFVGLIFCAALSETFGLVLSAKEKRGWTMNSAGYLLGPRRIEQLLKEMPNARGREEPPGEYAIDRIFSVKHGLAGKRDINLEENVKADTSTRLLTYNNIMRTIIEFLAYLHLKEAGALDNIVTTVSSEEKDQS
ncbi:galanin peptides [Ahaetulla prasina]|uniref:galanin peptides n=1 Tax=Ahaetulla prasina TaxID=499056 RepID=UPI00264735F5|nr:galanin peptides [Ahaetulla prasina]